MRLLLTCHAFTSHLRGMVPLAHAARRAGHVVAVAAPESLAEEARAHGVDHVVAGYDWWPDACADVRARGGKLSGPLSDSAVRNAFILQYFAAGFISRRAPDLPAVVRDWRPDVVVREDSEFGGALAAAAVGVPHVAVAVGGNSARWFDVATVLPLLRSRCRTFGLSSALAEQAIRPVLHAYLMPPEYDPDELTIPRTRCYRHENPLRVGEEQTSSMSACGARPVVLASFGSLTQTLEGDDRHLLHRLIGNVLAALADLDCRAVVALAGDIERYGRQPDHVRIVRGVAQPLVLAQCDLFLTHAGFNSVRESLYWGVPMVAIPLFAEQPYNAARCAELGLARVVRLSDATRSAVLTGCAEVLGDPSFSANAQVMRRRMFELPPLEVLVRDIEAICGGRTVAGVPS